MIEIVHIDEDNFTMKQFIECDLLGNEIEVGGLRGKYQEPPFTVLDTRGGSWQLNTFFLL